LFSRPLFRELGDFAKITGHEYVYLQQSVSSASKNSKIKGAKIILWT